MESLEVINQRLVDIYGRSMIQDLPNYRVVWAGSQREVRTGLYAKHTEAGIYLGEAVLTQEVEKYPDWKDYWVLEVPFWNHNNPELKADFSYEPLFFFKDPNGNPLPYDWEVIEKVVFFHRNKRAPMTQKEMDHD